METGAWTEQTQDLERLGTLFDVVEAVRSNLRSVQTIGACLDVEIDPMTCVLASAADLCTRAGLGPQALLELHRDGVLERLAGEVAV